ncbi:hypothetical protein B0A49_08145, partial [Cryomyces minteri]
TWLTYQLLASPTFHRAVHKVHRKVRHLTQGKSPEEMGGTNIEKQGPTFLEHFKDEIKEQFRSRPPKR